MTGSQKPQQNGSLSGHKDEPSFLRGEWQLAQNTCSPGAGCLCVLPRELCCCFALLGHGDVADDKRRLGDAERGMALHPMELEGGSLWLRWAARRRRAHLLGMCKTGHIPLSLRPIAPSPSLRTSPWADYLCSAEPGFWPLAQHLPAHPPQGSGPHRRQVPWRVRGCVCNGEAGADVWDGVGGWVSLSPSPAQKRESCHPPCVPPLPGLL